MKKLLLASDGKFLFEKGYKLLGIPINEIRLGYITTAANDAPNRGYLETHKQTMKKAGLDFEEMDIEGKTNEELKQFLSDKNVIHVEGGNSFYLLKAMKETGFDKILTEKIRNGLIYVGTSAGAYIACPTIEMSTWTKQRNHYGMTNLSALNLVPFLVKAHYTEKMKPIIQEKMKDCRYPLRILRDGQGVLVEGEKYTFVGEGKEVIL